MPGTSADAPAVLQPKLPLGIISLGRWLWRKYVQTAPVATMTTQSGLSPLERHLMLWNFSAPMSAPKPASVTTRPCSKGSRHQECQ